MKKTQTKCIIEINPSNLLIVSAMLAVATVTASHVAAEEEGRYAKEQTKEHVRSPAMAATTMALDEATPARHPRVGRFDAAYGRLVHGLQVHLSPTHLLLPQNNEITYSKAYERMRS